MFLHYLRCSCLPLLLASATAQAQTGGFTNASPRSSDITAVGQLMASGKGLRARPEAQGTPLLLPYWTQGWVQTSSRRIGALWLKYDLAGNQLLYRQPAGDSVALETYQLQAFALGDSLRGTRSTFRRYPAIRSEDAALATAFLEVLHDNGGTALLCRRTKELTAGTTSPSLNAASLPAWRGQTQYYIKKRDNLLIPVRLAPKAVLAALGPERQEVLSAYVKQEHLALKNAPDVGRLLAYYDTL